MYGRRWSLFPGITITSRFGQERITHTLDASGLSNADEWRALFGRLYSGRGEVTYAQRAARLCSYGWQPTDLSRVCSQPVEVGPLRDIEDVSAGEIDALAALAQEAVTYYSHGLSIASYRRKSYLSRLAEFGWARTEIGRRIGLTKQRVLKLMK